MKEVCPEVAQQVIDQNEIRQKWMENDTPEKVEHFFREEYEEWRQAREQAMIGDSAFEYASEVGDMAYLYIKRMNMGEVPDWMEATMNFVAGEAVELGFDLNDCIEMKIMRNDLKYPATQFNNGKTYGEARAWCKEMWNHMGGDANFSEAYLNTSE